jgi:Fe2+ or Zn2+ uptake regulation protein
MTGRTVSVFATVQIELDIEFETLELLGEKKAIERTVADGEFDSVELVSVDDLRCNDCGSASPFHCLCLDQANDEDDARQLDQADRYRERLSA